MKNNTQRLTDWAINRIKSEFPEDVALLVAVEGQSVNGDGHSECFDYYIPATERGLDFGKTFIIGGVGHDLYPRTWERMERTADFQDWFTAGLGKAKILYSRNPEDERRFLSLRQRMLDNLKNKEFMHGRALEKIDQAMTLYRTMLFEDKLCRLRMGAGYISDFLSDAAAYLNGAYLDDWKTGNIAQLKRLPALPDKFLDYCEAVRGALTDDGLKELSRLMICSVRAFAGERAPKPQKNPPPADMRALAEWYQELALIRNRLAYYCQTENAEMAFADACYLQSELIIAEEEFGLKEMDLLGGYSPRKLPELKAKSEEFEKYIAGVIKSGGGNINEYATVDEFLKNN